MKAPDKIYLHEISAEELTENFPYHICYIRKDALMEWAKENQEQMKIEAGGCTNMLAAGKYLAYKEIIDKIESL